MEEETLYEQFIYCMEKIGLKREFSILEDKDVILSDDDKVIYIEVPKDGIDRIDTISIKGIQEASIRGRMITHPYYITLKVYGYGGEEAKQEDTVQFSITEFKKGALSSKEISSHIVYYHYPYRIASGKLRLKRGIVITKDRRLEIRIIRNGEAIKIGKFSIKIECDKWYKQKMLAKDN